MPRTGKRSNAAYIENRGRLHEALELRKRGWTFKAIAEQCKWNSASACYQAVVAEINKIPREAAEEVLRLDLERLNDLWDKHFQAAKDGNIGSLTACIRIMERRAKLLGLDAPVKQEVKQEIVGGVLIAPGMVAEETWTSAAQHQQQHLKDQEAKVSDISHLRIQKTA